MNRKAQRGTWQLTAFGVKVKKKMLERNMTMKDLAREIGMSTNYLSMILHGKREGKNYIDLIKDELGLKDGKKNAEKAG